MARLIYGMLNPLLQTKMKLIVQRHDQQNLQIRAGLDIVEEAFSWRDDTLDLILHTLHSNVWQIHCQKLHCSPTRRLLAFHIQSVVSEY